MQEHNARFTVEKCDEAEFFILEALQGINKSLAIVNERLEKLLLSEVPDYIKFDLDEAYKAETNAQQMMLRLILRCLKDFCGNKL